MSKANFVNSHLFIPFPKGKTPALAKNTTIIPFSMEKAPGRLLKPKQTIQLYQAWKNGTLSLNSVGNTNILLEVGIEDEGQTYFYHYPIDLNYLFSPEWRKDNLASPSGFFRWATEMDLALRLNMVSGYEGKRLANRVLKDFRRKIKLLEESLCGYKHIDLPIASTLNLNTFLSHLTYTENIACFLGNNRLVDLAKKVDINYLGQLFSALSNLTNSKGIVWAEVLDYNKIDLSVAKTEILLKELETNWQSYRGNNCQIALAKKVGISNLGHLFSALANLTNSEGIVWTERLEYNKINLPATKVKALLKELETNWQSYPGNNSQITLGKKISISNLGQLFSALANLTNSEDKSWAKVLGYNQINLSITKIEALLEELGVNWQSYHGNNHQIALAKKVGISHLGHLFSVLSNFTNSEGLTWTEILKYNKINLPATKVEALLQELETNWQSYRGNSEQVTLAKKIGIGSLGQLFSALANLTNSEDKSWAKTLGHTYINLPITKVETLLKELETNWQSYRGNSKQITLGKKIGISYLGQLFSALSSLTNPEGNFWTEILDYNKIVLSTKKIDSFFPELVSFATFYHIPYNKFIGTFTGLTPQECQQRFNAIQRSSLAVKQVIEQQKREDWPPSFYGYLLKTTPFLLPDNDPVEITEAIINYIETNQQKIETTLSRFGGEPLTYGMLRPYFGEFTLPVIKFYGGLNGIAAKNRGGLKEWLALDLPSPMIKQQGMDFFHNNKIPSPLEALLIKEERAQRAALKSAVLDLPLDDRNLIQRMFYENETPENLVATLGISQADLEFKLDKIFARLKKLIGA
ncbi:MAG: hypothetical protein PHH14_04075 [Candidatus Margulisbacteria bacterium]|nr:hypothetical protein [Candidatus Margulisiibacteriota bacterium]